MLTEEQTQETTEEKPAETTTETTEEINIDDLFATEEKPTTLEKPRETTPPEKAQETQEEKEQKLLAKVQATVQQVLEQSTSSIEKRTQRESEITTFLTSDKGKMYASYAKEIAKVAKDPRFANLPMNRIVGLTLSDETILKIGAKMSKEAKNEAARNGTGGSSSTSSETQGKDVWQMSDAEFEQMEQDALNGKFLKK